MLHTFDFRSSRTVDGLFAVEKIRIISQLVVQLGIRILQLALVRSLTCQTELHTPQRTPCPYSQGASTTCHTLSSSECGFRMLDRRTLSSLHSTCRCDPGSVPQAAFEGSVCRRVPHKRGMPDQKTVIVKTER